MRQFLCLFIFCFVSVMVGCDDTSSPAAKYCDGVDGQLWDGPGGWWIYGVTEQIPGQVDVLQTTPANIPDHPDLFTVEDCRTIGYFTMKCAGGTLAWPRIRMPITAEPASVTPGYEGYTSWGSTETDSEGKFTAWVRAHPGPTGALGVGRRLILTIQGRVLFDMSSGFFAKGADIFGLQGKGTDFYGLVMQCGHGMEVAGSATQGESTIEVPEEMYPKATTKDIMPMAMEGMSLLSAAWLRQDPNKEQVAYEPTSNILLYPAAFMPGADPNYPSPIEMSDPNFYKDALPIYVRLVLQLVNPLTLTPNANAYSYIQVVSCKGATQYLISDCRVRFESYNAGVKQLQVVIGPIVPLLWETGKPYMSTLYEGGHWGETTVISVKPGGCLKILPPQDGSLIDIAEGWLKSVDMPGLYPLGADFDINGKIDFDDFSNFAAGWNGLI